MARISRLLSVLMTMVLQSDNCRPIIKSHIHLFRHVEMSEELRKVTRRIYIQ